MESLLSYNPYVLISALLTVVVFIVILRPPKWLGRVPTDVSMIAFLVMLGALYSVYRIGPQDDYYGLWLISVIVSVAGAVLTYVYRQRPAQAFKIMCIAFTIIVWSLFSYKMLRTPLLLDADERQYLSISAVATGGHGLYPALQNFPSIPVQGGVGYMVWLYVLAYQILGPSVLSLRIIALLFSFLSIPPVFFLFRRWYGSVTAWLAIAILPVTLLYATIFSTRMDIYTVTCLWWGLLLADVAREKNKLPWHFAAGLFLGLCLEVHIHTSVTTVAVGILYLVDYARQRWQSGRWSWPSAVLAYSAGALLGLGIFVTITIMPNPESFFRTAGDATRFAYISIDPNAPLLNRLITSFTSIGWFADSFVQRWVLVFQFIYPVELIFWVAAFVGLYRRRAQRPAWSTMVLVVAALVAGFFILNHYVLVYTTHIGPILLLCVPPFFTYGLSRRRSFDWEQITPALVLVLSVCVLPIYMTATRVRDSIPPELPAPPAEDAQAIEYVKAHVSHNCKVMGTDEMFYYYLPMYTWYHTGDNSLGGRYYNFTKDEQLWEEVDPDIVIATEGIMDSLRAWIVEADYKEIGPSVWQKTRSPLTADCQVTP